MSLTAEHHKGLFIITASHVFFFFPPLRSAAASRKSVDVILLSAQFRWFEGFSGTGGRHHWDERLSSFQASCSLKRFFSGL